MKTTRLLTETSIAMNNEGSIFIFDFQNNQVQHVVEIEMLIPDSSLRLQITDGIMHHVVLRKKERVNHVPDSQTRM